MKESVVGMLSWLHPLINQCVHVNGLAMPRTLYTWCLGIFYLLKLSYFLHKHQMKATKNSQAYAVGTHGCV